MEKADVISIGIAKDHVHMFSGYRPTQNINKIMQGLKGINSRILPSEFPICESNSGVAT